MPRLMTNAELLASIRADADNAIRQANSRDPGALV